MSCHVYGICSIGDQKVHLQNLIFLHLNFSLERSFSIIFFTPFISNSKMQNAHFCWRVRLFTRIRWLLDCRNLLKFFLLWFAGVCGYVCVCLCVSGSKWWVVLCYAACQLTLTGSQWSKNRAAGGSLLWGWGWGPGLSLINWSAERSLCDICVVLKPFTCLSSCVRIRRQLLCWPVSDGHFLHWSMKMVSDGLARRSSVTWNDLEEFKWAVDITKQIWLRCLISWLKSYKKKIYEFKDIIVIGTDNMVMYFSVLCQDILKSIFLYTGNKIFIAFTTHTCTARGCPSMYFSYI